MRIILSLVSPLLVSLLAITLTQSCRNRETAQIKDASGDRIANKKGDSVYPLYWTVAVENANYICRRFCSSEPSTLLGKNDKERQIELVQQRKSCSGDIVYRKITAQDLAKSNDPASDEAATVLNILSDDSRENHMVRLDETWTATVEKFLNPAMSRQSASGRSGPKLPKGISDTTTPELPEGISDSTEADYLCLGTSPKQDSPTKEKVSEGQAQQPEPQAQPTRVKTSNSSSSRNTSRNDASGVSKANALKASGNELKKNFWGRSVPTDRGK